MSQDNKDNNLLDELKKKIFYLEEKYRTVGIGQATDSEWEDFLPLLAVNKEPTCRDNSEVTEIDSTLDLIDQIKLIGTLDPETKEIYLYDNYALEGVIGLVKLHEAKKHSLVRTEISKELEICGKFLEVAAKIFPVSGNQQHNLVIGNGGKLTVMILVNKINEWWYCTPENNNEWENPTETLTVLKEAVEKKHNIVIHPAK